LFFTQSVEIFSDGILRFNLECLVKDSLTETTSILLSNTIKGSRTVCITALASLKASNFSIICFFLGVI
jgi:hypothetical protein